MVKKQKTLDLTTKQPLIDRQRRLWANAEAIEIAQKMGKPLPIDVSEWLHRALKNIACGEDANEVFNVLPGKRGIRKDGFLREMRAKVQNGFIAAATESSPQKPKLMTTVRAVKTISEAMSDSKHSTVRKNYNKASTDRKPTFTFGKK
jgi:hypothetical protein